MALYIPDQNLQEAMKIVQEICGGKTIYVAKEAAEKRDAYIKYFIDKQNEKILSLQNKLSEIEGALSVIAKYGGYAHNNIIYR